MAILKNITFAGQTPFEPTTGYLLDVTFGTIILLSGLLSILLNSMVLLLKVRPHWSQTNILFSIQSTAYIIITLRSLVLLPNWFSPNDVSGTKINKKEGLGHAILDTVEFVPLICSWLLSGSCMLKIRDGFITIKSRWMTIIFCSSSAACLISSSIRCYWGNNTRYFYHLAQMVIEERCNISSNGTVSGEICLGQNLGTDVWFRYVFVMTISAMCIVFSAYSVFLLLKTRDAPQATEANTKKACKTLIFMNLTNAIYFGYTLGAMNTFRQGSFSTNISHDRAQAIAIMVIIGTWVLKVAVAVITPSLILYFGYSLQKMKSAITNVRRIMPAINVHNQ